MIKYMLMNIKQINLLETTEFTLINIVPMYGYVIKNLSAQVLKIKIFYYY